jgi:hypothetical protein
MSRTKGTQNHIFEAGEYFIGDPCYFIWDNWEKLLDRTGCFGLHEKQENGEKAEFNDGVYEHNGKTCFVAPTMWGDGCYEAYDFDTDSQCSIGVDAGLIGIMPVDAVETVPQNWVMRKTFPASFMVCRDDVGTFYFGSVKIVTQ